MAYNDEEEVHIGDNQVKAKSRKHDKSKNKDETQIPISEMVASLEDGEGSVSGSLDKKIIST